jgi:predicted alpha/beta superfamily hydrolase
MKSIYFLLIVILISFSPQLLSQKTELDLQTSDVSLNYSETIALYSEMVQDSFYIYIKLPKDYNTNLNKTYPAIFLLDGDIAFPMAWSIVRYLQYGEYVPDVLIIGIGYGGLFSSNKINKRERDYSISKIEGLKESGGGIKFLKFIKKELLPFINSRYRLDSTKLTLSGHSLGGLFLLYAMFSEPEIFSNYIASSPYTLHDIDKLLSLEDKNLNNIKDSNNRLFISFGANEDKKEFIEPINKIVNRLSQIDSCNFKLKFKVFEDGVHFSTPAEALTYGLIFSFQ